MEIINFAERSSLVGQYMSELREVGVQDDRLRFRHNLERIGQIMAYEISKRLRSSVRQVRTPLGVADCRVPDAKIVLGTIMRAGIPFHQGFLDYMDGAENAFVSAYRHYTNHDTGEFDIRVEYLAAPDITGKTLILADPMLATGGSMELSYKALLSHGQPEQVHLAAVIASRKAVSYLESVMPFATLWVGAIDDVINEQSYIVPGLGDAGDLAYGTKI